MKLKSSVVVVLSLIGAPAVAAPAWYVSGGVASTRLESDGLQAAAADVGLAVSNEVSDTAFGFQLAGGVTFNDVFGVELKYSDSGDGEDDVFFTDGVIIVPVNVEISIDGFTLYGVAQTQLAGSWDVFGKLGYTLQDGELDASAFGVSASDSDDDDGIAAAAGLRYRFDANWAVTGELEYFSIDFDGAIDEPLRGSLNVQYFFSAF
jgi:opacity protein-like surface antigen